MILVLGDSHTYGHGLRYCENPERDPPSPMAWPGKLKIPVTNGARSGASNAEILLRFLEHYQPGKFSGIVVLWSFLARILHRVDTPSGLMSDNSATSNPFLQQYFAQYYDDRVANNDLLAYVNLINTMSDVPVLHDFLDSNVDRDLFSRISLSLVQEDNFNSLKTLWRVYPGSGRTPT